MNGMTRKREPAPFTITPNGEVFVPAQYVMGGMAIYIMGYDGISCVTFDDEPHTPYLTASDAADWLEKEAKTTSGERGEQMQQAAEVIRKVVKEEAKNQTMR